MITPIKKRQQDSRRASFSPQTAAALHSQSRSSKQNDIGKAVWRARLLFILCLSIVAVALGYIVYYYLKKGEEELAETMFESIADRALSQAVVVAQQKRWSAITMASIISTMFPNASTFPFVTIPNYGRIVSNLLNTSSNLNMGYAPIVLDWQLEEWESFIYDYYYIRRKPTPYPNTTAVSSFGRGVWGKNESLPSTMPQQRYKDYGNTTYYGSPNRIVTPISQTNHGSPNSILLFNLHSEEERGEAIDDMIQCSRDRQNTREALLSDRDCGVITDMVEFVTTPIPGPSAITYTPIFPANDPYTLVGLISTPILWDQLLNNAFAAEVSGIDCVLETESRTFTFTIENGIPKTRGYGDRHDERYSRFRRHIEVTTTSFYTENSPQYTLSLYPTDQLYDVYSTPNPMVATIGAVCLIFFMSLLFYLYDFLVRREFLAKKELLAAKRSFMRFVSHEVRTPLNAVCMGLTLIQMEMAHSLGFASVEELRAEVAREKDGEETQPMVSLPAQRLSAMKQSSGHPGLSARESVEDPDEHSAVNDHETTAAPLFSLTPATSKNRPNDCDKVQPPIAPLFATTQSTVSSSGTPERKDKSELTALPLFSTSTTTRANEGVDASRQDVMEWFRLSQDILRNTLSAVDVLSDVLNYDKIEAGSLTLELAKISIWELVEATMKEFRLSAQRKNIDLQLEFATNNGESDDVEAQIPSKVSSVADISQAAKDCKVIGDTVRLIQVVRNLMSNAIKFTPEKGSIHVTATWHNATTQEQTPSVRSIHLGKGEKIELPQMGTVTLTVNDTGAGMSPQQLQCLFREGIQFNANELQQGHGSGFGLFISKGIVEMHEGSLVAESAGLGEGTAFTMTLPLYHSPDEGPTKAHEACPARPMTSMEASSTLNVLVVDDAVSNRKLLVRLLKLAGHTCDQAEDGDIALEMVENKRHEGGRYDTILLDYEMPRLDGPTTANELRHKGCDAFIVGITGNMLPEDVSYFLSCGANAVLPKPLKIADLLNLWVEHDIRSCSMSSQTITANTTASTTFSGGAEAERNN